MNWNELWMTVFGTTHWLGLDLGFWVSMAVVALIVVAMNVVFFLPLGYFMKRVFRWKFATALPAMFLTSLLIETTQLTGIWGIYPCAYRLFDVDDLITNTLGGILGYAMGSIVTHFLPQQRIDEDAITTEPGFVRRCVALWIDLVIVWLVAVVPYGAVAVGFEVAGLTPPTFPDMTANQTAALVINGLALIALVVVEVVIPWFHDGSTPGGSFVRMTFETHPRTTGYRVVFYAARSATLVLAYLWVPWMVIILLIFYLVKREMPYDLIP